MLAYTKEGLVERGEPLLAIQDEESVCRAVERRRPFEFTGGEYPLGIAHSQDAPSRIVVRDRDDQLLGRSRLPDKIALEVRKHRRAIVDVGQEMLQRARIGVFKETHMACSIAVRSTRLRHDRDIPKPAAELRNHHCRHAPRRR